MWRAATSDDDEAIVRLSLALFAEDPSPEIITADQVRRTLIAFREHPVRERAVVLEIDGRIAGYAFLINYWSNELGGEICTIDELYVEADLRGRGYGTSLIASLRDFVALELEVTPANAKAQALYERLGFRVKKNAVMRKKFSSGST